VKPTTILVTGCSGFIGSNLCLSLLKQGHTVFGIDNFDPYYPRKVKEINNIALLGFPNFTFFEADITDKNALEMLPDELRPAVVVHLAAKAGVRPSMQDPEGYFHNNLFGTECLLKWMIRRGSRKMIFASSSSIYGNTRELPFVETADLSVPLSPYAATKIAGEQINLSYHLQNGLDVLNLRFFTVYGPRQRPDLAIHKFLIAMRQGREIVLYGDGNSSRDYTYVEDILAGIENSITYLLTHEKVFESINLGSGRPITLSQMISILGEEAGCIPEIVHSAQQPGDMENTFASIAKAEKLLNYHPEMTFREGVRRFVAWFDTQYDVISAVENS
jgi:nucleoside-diphosphate-sugar epimerase